MDNIKARLGEPIYNRDRSEIWAFWNEDWTFTGRYFNFITRPRFLGMEDDDLNRTTQVVFTGNQWVAGDNTTQADLAQCPFFFMNPLQGPQARLAAIRLLLKDPEFGSHFRHDDSMADRFKAYETHLERVAKRNW